MSFDVPAVAELTVAELVTVIRGTGDDAPTPLRHVEVPAALEELKRRAGAHSRHEAGDVIEARSALRILDVILNPATDQQRAEADGTVAAPADPEPALEPVPDPPAPTGEPSPLESAGFMALRGTVFAGAQQIESVSPDTFDRLIRFAEDARTRARILGAPRGQLDAVDTDLAVLRACKKLRQALKDLNETAAARAKLTGAGPAA